MGEETWRGYHKFCFEWNPWDRVISAYYWTAVSKGSSQTLAEFIESPLVLRLKERGIRAYTIEGKVVVDQICRFENLRQELKEIRERIGERFADEIALMGYTF